MIVSNVMGTLVRSMIVNNDYVVLEVEYCFVVGAYPYATCFVCKKIGHISKDCPDNDHGLYPNGGCCLDCGSVRHFRKDCPGKQRKQGMLSLSCSSLLYACKLHRFHFHTNSVFIL